MTTTVTLAVPCIYCKDSYNITANQEDLMDWQAGKLIQYALPYLNLHERELLISNTCQSCFDDIFPPYCGDCLVPIKECHHASM
jgi:hypothetical protein